MFLVICSAPIAANGHIYEMLGIAGSTLSAVTKANAGQNISSNHLTPNILYMMLGAGIYLVLTSLNLFFVSMYTSLIFKTFIDSSCFLFFKTYIKIITTPQSMYTSFKSKTNKGLR